MHVYLLNWRDIRHPRMGGAEVLTHGLFSRLAASGHRVTWFAGDFRGAKRSETINGIEIVRGGNAVTVCEHARRYYRSVVRDVDIVVDGINTLPFFAPLYARVPVVAFFHQLAREVWFYEAPAGIAQLGYAMEPLYLMPYRRVPILTVSQSSAESLRTEMHFKGPMSVMPMAIDQHDVAAPLPLAERDETIVMLGRVTPSKRLDHAIRALALLNTPPFDRLRLEVIGGGSDDVRERLNRLAASLGVSGRIVWSGFLDEERKRERLRRARLLVMTSAREGWGLAVSEANLAGTPAAGYRVRGLRDSIRDGVTGRTTEESPQALAQAITELLSNPEQYASLAGAAQSFAQSLTWDASTAFVERVLVQIASNGSARGAST